MEEEVFLKSRGKSGTERGQGNQGERQGKDEAKRGKMKLRGHIEVVTMDSVQFFIKACYKQLQL